MKKPRWVFVASALYFGAGAGCNSKKPEQVITPDSVFGSCQSCDVQHLKFVGITCSQDKTAQVLPSDITVNHESALPWVVLGSGGESWSVTFDKASPCQSKSFSRNNQVCEVTGTPGQYNYTVKLQSCPNLGKGIVTVK